MSTATTTTNNHNDNNNNTANHKSQSPLSTSMFHPMQLTESNNDDDAPSKKYSFSDERTIKIDSIAV